MKIRLRRPKLTREEKRRLVADYLRGLPVAAILARYGISRPTLYRVLREMAREPAA